jgi:hypothetical protein
MYLRAQKQMKVLDIHDEIKKLISGNVQHYSVQNILPSYIIYNNKKQTAIVLVAVVNGCDTLSLTVRVKERQMESENSRYYFRLYDAG